MDSSASEEEEAEEKLSFRLGLVMLDALCGSAQSGEST